MKTPPDDTTLTLWLDDELEGEQLAQVEAWAADHPDQLKAREQVRQWRRMISDALPASQQPPAPEFFNERILHAIRMPSPPTHGETDIGHSGIKPRQSSRKSWGGFWMPLTACAGMVLAFWLGALAKPDKTSTGTTSNGEGRGPHLYTPEQGVNAQWFSSSDASATVIVLKGVSAIPDEIDFNAVGLRQTWREIDSTAASESPTPNK